MIPKIFILAMIGLFIATPGYVQVKSKKELKEERIQEKKKQTEELINSKEFVFTGRIALPQGMKPVDLTTHFNYVNFHPDQIESNLPYYGQAYAVVGYSGDTGLKFEGKPEKFTVKKGKRTMM